MINWHCESFFMQIDTFLVSFKYSIFVESVTESSRRVCVCGSVITWCFWKSRDNSSAILASVIYFKDKEVDPSCVKLPLKSMVVELLITSTTNRPLFSDIFLKIVDSFKGNVANLYSQFYACWCPYTTGLKWSVSPQVLAKHINCGMPSAASGLKIKLDML